MTRTHRWTAPSPLLPSVGDDADVEISTSETSKGQPDASISPAGCGVGEEQEVIGRGGEEWVGAQDKINSTGDHKRNRNETFPYVSGGRLVNFLPTFMKS
jgi:hypothetical protein